MASLSQQEKARLLRDLHHGPPILVLPNAWDAASARIFEQTGFHAIATTSAGIAYALGYPDGQHIGRSEMLEVVERIARVASVPVTADMEAGYGRRPEDAADTARGVIEAGAVGMNLEDATHDPAFPLEEIPRQFEKIRAIREVAAAAKIPLVLNARTDVYLLGVGEPAARFESATLRLNAYREAGADCLFVPGVKEPELIARLAREVRGPLNILAVAGTPPPKQLERLGVARVSTGSGPMGATLTLLQQMAADLLNIGSYESFAGKTISHADANRLFQKAAAG